MSVMTRLRTGAEELESFSLKAVREERTRERWLARIAAVGLRGELVGILEDGALSPTEEQFASSVREANHAMQRLRSDMDAASLGPILREKLKIWFNVGTTHILGQQTRLGFRVRHKKASSRAEREAAWEEFASQTLDLVRPAAKPVLGGEPEFSRFTLSLGVSALEYIEGLAEVRYSLIDEWYSGDEQEAAEAELREHLDGWLSDKLIGRVIDALAEVLDAKKNRRASGDESTVESLKALLMPVHRAAAAVMTAVRLYGRPLSADRRAVLLEALGHVADPLDPYFSCCRIWKLSAAEGQMFGVVFGDDPDTDEVVEYVERRIATLESELESSFYSGAERQALSGWVWSLVHNASGLTNRFEGTSAGRAVELLDRANAEAFCSEMALYSKAEWSNRLMGNIGDLGKTGEAEGVAERPSRTQEWRRWLMAIEHLDFYSHLEVYRDSQVHWGMPREVVEKALGDPPELLLSFSHDESLDVLVNFFGIPTGEWSSMEGRWVTRVQARTPEWNSGQVDRFRRYVRDSWGRLKDRDAKFADVEMPKPDRQQISDFLRSRPKTAIVVPGTGEAWLAPLDVFVANKGGLRRVSVDSPGKADLLAQHFVALTELADGLNDDRNQPSPSALSDAGEKLRECTEAFGPWMSRLAAKLGDLGCERVAVLTRGRLFPLLPLESVPVESEGTLFGDRFETGYLYTLAGAPDVERRAPSSRGNTQIFGSGAGGDTVEPGAVVQRSLAKVGVAGEPEPGGTFNGNTALFDTIRGSRRLRCFLHGYRNFYWPEHSRLTVVDAEDAELRFDLRAQQIRTLPLGQCETVELWGCEGVAHNRPFRETGPCDEPEGLARSFLIGGADRVVGANWHVPALPAAVMMERFALNLEEGFGEVAALARARSSCRETFREDGEVSKALTEQLSERLVRLVDGESSDSGRRQARSKARREAFVAALHDVRGRWYERAGLEPPEEKLGANFARMVKFLPPRGERRDEGSGDYSEREVSSMVDEMLEPYRNPVCWAGWRVVLRGLEAWR